MTNKKLGIGIIGVQGYGSTYFKTIAGLDNAQVLAVCDSKADVLERTADEHRISCRFADYREMLKRPEVDAVFIATPHFLHYRMTIDALNAGKHVFCEKPLAMNAAEADEMVHVAREKGLILSCHFNRRQSAAVKMLREAVQKGVLGDIYALNLKWMARYTPFMFAENSSWRVDKAKAGGGILIGRGSHMLDAALYILGMPEIKSITANVCAKLTGFPVDDYALLILRLDNDSTVTIECSYENNIPQYEEKIEYQAFGTKAGAYSLQQDGRFSFELGYCAFPENRWVDLGAALHPEDYAAVYPVSIIQDFVEAVVGGREPLITGETGAYITRILDAAYQSAEFGQEIRLK